MRGRALGICQAGQPRSLCCGAICGGGVWKGTMPLAQLSDGFQSLPPLLISKLGPSSADSWVGGFVYVLGPCGSLQLTLLWGWEFLPLLLPPQVFTTKGFDVLFPHIGTLGCVVCLAPYLFFPVYLHTNGGPPNLPTAALPTPVTSRCVGMCLVCLRCWSPPLFPVWMNVYSLTPWLSDFHIVQYSDSSGYFCF